MKAIAKLFLKTILFFGIPFVIVMMLLFSDSWSGIEPQNVLIRYVIVAIIISTGVVIGQINSLKSRGIKEFTDETFSVKKHKLFQSSITKEELVKKLRLDPVFGKMKMDVIENVIFLKSGISLQSFGQEINIIVNQRQDSKNDYSISVKPKIVTTMFDFGKSLDILDRFQYLISA
ncbi:MAG: hypothetical protein PHQ11_07850 [Paludibacter sp.]|jgi:hypothetical protein|nr:hypothetical protein [Paludibacter sp.]